MTKMRQHTLGQVPSCADAYYAAADEGYRGYKGSGSAASGSSTERPRGQLCSADPLGQAPASAAPGGTG